MVLGKTSLKVFLQPSVSRMTELSRPVSHSFSCTVQEVDLLKAKALQWAKRFPLVVALDNNGYQSEPTPAFDFMLAVGESCEIEHRVGPGNSQTGLQKLREIHTRNPGWLLGFLGYDLKNELENLVSNNPDFLGFPDLCFFAPRIILRIINQELTLETTTSEVPELLVQQILDGPPISTENTTSTIPFATRFSKTEYLKTIQTIKDAIREGDYYEINFCQEFFAERTIQPFETFYKLNQVSPAPFASFVRFYDRFLLGASPERFLKKTGDLLLSQPIKGTSKRGASAKEDFRLRQELFQNPKDRAENVMIVDLVRNDLARCCLPGSVNVPELFGIYSFPQVHQMISTVTGNLRPELHFTDALAATFPMGSMTGAPKIISMQQIDALERSRRGLFSGAVGYITPEGDFDFNVVIRSLLYHAETRYLSYQTGGAIVYDSDPEAEYRECLLKGSAIRQIL